MSHGLALDLLGDGHGFRALGLHEFQPSGGGVEKVAHLHPRPMRAGEGRRLGLAHRPAFDKQRMGLGDPFRPRGQGQPRHRTDGRQGLAAEPQGGDAQQVPGAVGVRRKLGGRVALHRKGELLAGQPLAIVGHQDTAQPAAVSLDLNPARAGVDGVFHQLLDGARRPFDHFAGGDAVDGFGRETADGHRVGSWARPHSSRFHAARARQLAPRPIAAKVAASLTASPAGRSFC